MISLLDLSALEQRLHFNGSISRSETSQLIAEVRRLRAASFQQEPRPLTQRQAEILSFLVEYIDDKGYAPSFEEIASRFGYRALATVHEHLGNLQRKGWIEREFNESRSIKVLARPAKLELSA